MDQMDMSLNKLVTEKPGVLQSMGSQRVGHDWATELTPEFAKGELCSPLREQIKEWAKSLPLACNW